MGEEVSHQTGRWPAGAGRGGPSRRLENASLLSAEFPFLLFSLLLVQPLLYSKGENSQEFSPTFSERIFIAGSKQYR